MTSAQRQVRRPASRDTPEGGRDATGRREGVWNVYSDEATLDDQAGSTGRAAGVRAAGHGGLGEPGPGGPAHRGERDRDLGGARDAGAAEGQRQRVQGAP